jgi:hypothetical protein
MDTATAERPLKAVGEEDDGLGPPADPPVDPDPDPNPDPPVDPEAEVTPPEDDPPAGAAGQGPPPTPPASLPDDGAGEEEEEPESQLLLMADRQLGLRVGGRKPDSSVLKLKGGKIDLQGQFDRGDRFLAVTTLQVTGDNDQDTIEKLSGEVKSTSKAQNATLCGITRIEEYLANRIADDELLNAVLAALELDPAQVPVAA